MTSNTQTIEDLEKLYSWRFNYRYYRCIICDELLTNGRPNHLRKVHKIKFKKDEKWETIKKLFIVV